MIRPVSDDAEPDLRHTAYDVMTLMYDKHHVSVRMNALASALVLVGMTSAMSVPATVSAHDLQPVVPISVAPQPVSWVVLVMLAALGTFALIVGAATGLQVVRRCRRQALAARTQALFTSSMAGCAVIALVAFVATQLIPASATMPATAGRLAAQLTALLHF